MSSPARPARARRGRVMIVGDIPELARIRPMLQQSPVQAANLFEALGEITIAPAGMPISTVLLADQLMQGMSAHAIEALRKLDPAVRVVMIAAARAGAAPTASDWMSRGVDDCIAAPFSPADVNRLFDEDTLVPGASLGEPAPSGEAAAPAGPPAPAPPSQPASPHSQLSSELEPGAEPSIRQIPVEPAIPSEPQQPPSTPAPVEIRVTEQLGDTDLLEAIMAGSGRLREITLRLIVQQTQWTDIALSAEGDLQSALGRSDQPPTPTPAVAANPKSGSSWGGQNPKLPATAVEVTFNGQRFGMLASAQAVADQLQPWADWLGHWLALDHSYQQLRFQVMQDDLTGAGNRRFFDVFLRDALARAAPARRPVTLMVFDIDNFKSFNDQFGHEAGDEILRETVRLMMSVIRQGDRVCRIGGDEFAVIFADPEAPREPGSKHPESIDVIAKRFQDQICNMRFPKLGVQAPATLSISAGLATYPWDGTDPAALMRHADQLALESKRKGKNVITFGPGAQQACGGQSP